MSERICFNQNAFLLGIIVITLIILLFNKHFGNKECPPCKPIIIQKKITEVPKKFIETTNENNLDIKLNNTIRNRDSKALLDDLSAPTRRLPQHLYPIYPSDVIPQIHTRGEPDHYHHYGNMIRSSDETIVKLFGRQIYPGSNQYEYYGITTDKNGAEIKIPIKITNDKEIYDGDEIEIDFLDISKGKFKLYMHDYDRPRYNPFTYKN